MSFLYNNFLADFFKMMLDWIHSFVSSYGWSIVILTILFRAVLMPLDFRQKKNMRRQQALQPKIDAINKKYANDREMQSRKMMELYKTEGFNPMSGCLPLLLQMPIFFAFFGALRALADEQVFALYETAKSGIMPQLESWLWVRNVWQPDNFWVSVVPAFKSLSQYVSFADVTELDYNAAMAPLVQQFANVMNGYFILPLLAGGASYLMSKMSTPQTATADPGKPGQGKMMQYLMPAFSVFICVSSSAAFALYWAVSNLVSVLAYVLANKYFDMKEEQLKELPPEPVREPERKYLK